MSLEERIPPTKDAQKYHASRPHVNGGSLMGILEENFRCSESWSTRTRGGLMAPGGREKRGEGAREKRKKDKEREIDRHTHTHTQRERERERERDDITCTTFKLDNKLT